MNTEQLIIDDYFRLGVSLVVLQLHGHQYPAKVRHNARINILSTWSHTARDGYTERGALITALAHLTTADRVATSLAGTDPADQARAAGLRHLLAHLTGQCTLRPAPRGRSEERDQAAVMMADGLLDALPELIDPTVLEDWAAAVADWEREHTGLWVIDLMASGFDPHVDVVWSEDEPWDEAAAEAWEGELTGTRWRLG